MGVGVGGCVNCRVGVSTAGWVLEVVKLKLVPSVAVGHPER